MKTAQLILAFACAIWIAQPSHAIQDSTRAQSSAEGPSASDSPKALSKQEASDEEPVHRRAAANKQPRGGGTATSRNRSQQIPKREGAPDSGAVRAASEGFVQNEILNSSALPTRPPRVAPGRGVTANNSRHRSPNPAVVDGAMNARNTGAINGTRIVRKP